MLGRVPQVLLEVGDLARELALGGAILCVLLLDLREVLELDSLTLEHATLHILDQLLLLLAEQLVLELHTMNFLLHGNDLALANRRVQSVLHLFLELVLALPKENLLLSIDDIDQDVTLLLLQLGDLILQLDGFVLHLLELLLKLHLDVKVIVREFLLLLVVLVDQVVELVHLEDLVLLGDFEFTDGFVVTLNLRVYPDLLLVQNRLLRAQVISLALNLVLLLLTLDELDLVRDPVLLDVSGFVIHLLDLLLNVVAKVLLGAD